MAGTLSRATLLLLAATLIALPATQSARAQLSPEIRDRTISAAVQIAIQITATDGIETETLPLAVGSGTVVSPDGLILTNWHVVDPGSHRDQVQAWRELAVAEGYDLELELDSGVLLVFVTESDRPPQQRYTATVVDEDVTLDLAVLQITGDLSGPIEPSALDIPYVPLGDSDAVQLGDPIDIFGYPLIGGDVLTYTTGVVSGFNAEPSIGNRAWITTDASTSGGSSGGTAIDRQGRLIGVPTQAPFLDCRPGDSNGDGRITADDVGCVPTGGSIGQLRPINLAIPLLMEAGWIPPPGPQATSESSGSASQPTEQQAPPTQEPNHQESTSTPTLAATAAPESDEAYAPEDLGNVSTFRGNPARTGEMPGPDPQGQIAELWRVEIGEQIWSSPAEIDDVLYVGTGGFGDRTGAVVALDVRSGEERWRFVGGPFFSSPTVSDDHVYITSGDGYLFNLHREDGTVIGQHGPSVGGSCGSLASPLVNGSTVIGVAPLRWTLDHWARGP